MLGRMQSSSKKLKPEGKDGKNLKASIMRSLTKRQKAMNDLNSSAKSRNKSYVQEKK